jgi:hypothetical protein
LDLRLREAGAERNIFGSPTLQRKESKTFLVILIDIVSALSRISSRGLGDWGGLRQMSEGPQSTLLASGRLAIIC